MYILKPFLFYVKTHLYTLVSSYSSQPKSGFQRTHAAYSSHTHITQPVWTLATSYTHIVYPDEQGTNSKTDFFR